jgi:hypothetical protein
MNVKHAIFIRPLCETIVYFLDFFSFNVAEQGGTEMHMETGDSSDTCRTRLNYKLAECALNCDVMRVIRTEQNKIRGLFFVVQRIRQRAHKPISTKQPNLVVQIQADSYYIFPPCASSND